MVQKHITAFQSREHVGWLGGLNRGQLGMGLGEERRVFQRIAVQVGQRE